MYQECKKSNFGFTLIELMITVTLVALLATVAVPSFFNLIQDQRLVGAANELVGAINFARSEAAKQGEDILIKRTGAAWTDGWEVETTSVSTVLLHTEAFQRIQISELNNLTQFRFFPNGGTSVGNNVQFDICDPSRAGETGRRITISVVGRPQTSQINCP